MTFAICNTKPSLANARPAGQERKISMKNNNNPISVRLSPEANAKCEDAAAKGFTRTEFINQSIMNIPYHNRQYEQKLLPHFCAMAELVSSLEEDSDIKDALRKELNTICRFLRSQKETI